VKMSALIGVLYLENNLTPRVFTTSRLAVLELLASQAAISLENARLYADLRQENSERSKAEEALRAGEERMNLAAEAANLAMWEWDMVKDEIWMTDKGRALFGIGLGERMNYAALMARVHPEDRATRDEAIRRALDPRGEYAKEYRILLPDGQVRWMAGVGRFEFGDGKPLWMRGASLDITERKQAELEAARQRSESERQLQDIIDNTTSIIFVKDLELRYLLVNREYERRFHVRRKEIRGKSDFDIHPQAVAEAVRANDRQVIEAGEPIEFEESVPSGGRDHHYVVVKFLLRDQAEKPYAVCGIATDITELKRAKELEAEMAREREMFLEEKTRLAGEIHDSLAQSFTGISMQLGMAEYVMTDRDNELFSYVERANDLARFGLAEARRSVLSLQSMIIKDSGLIESLQMLAERSNIAGRLRCTFRSNLKDDQSLPALVRQDLLRIAQEAISNALRHAKSTAIRIDLRFDPPNLVLKVKDDGCGMTTEAETREGFGFANMRARVKKLKGTLDIRTAPGRGTTIVVCVPLR